MSPLILKLRNWWETSDRTQKIITLGGISLLLLLMAGTAYFTTRPKYALLYSGMTEADKSVVVTEIQAMGVPVKYDIPGQVEIPQDKIGEVNMRLAGSGKMPKSAHPGIPDLEKMNLFSTPAQERERLKVILEGELAKTIEVYDSVQAARVHITLGDNSPFIKDKKPPTASVSITEASGGSLTPDQGRAIATLVAQACDGMNIRDVSVLNQRMQFIFNGQDMGDDRSMAADKIEMESRVAKQREREMQQTLDSVFGPGSTVVMVRCILDLDQQTGRVVDRTPSEVPQLLVKSGEKMKGTEITQGGTTGAEANGTSETAPGTTKPTTESLYDGKNIRDERAISEKATDTVKATGDIKSMTINVIANTDKIKELDKVQNIVNGEVKNHTTDPANFPLPTVTGVKFDTTAADAAAKAQADATMSARLQQLLSLVPILALIVVAWMVMRQINRYTNPPKEIVVAQVAPEEVFEDEPALLEEGEQMAALPEESEEAPFIDPEALLAALEAGDDESEFDIPDINNRVDIPLESLRKMADDRPQVFGQLIKSMLLEDRK